MGKRKTEREMLSIIRSSESRRKDIRSFCKDHGISTAVFYYWKKRLGDGEGNNRLVPLEILESDESEDKIAGEVALKFKSGTVIFKTIPGAQYLRSVLGLND